MGKGRVRMGTNKLSAESMHLTTSPSAAPGQELTSGLYPIADEFRPEAGVQESKFLINFPDLLVKFENS